MSAFKYIDDKLMLFYWQSLRLIPEEYLHKIKGKNKTKILPYVRWNR